MRKRTILAAVIALASCGPAMAADYDCKDQSTATALKQIDISISKREAAVAEMKKEMSEAGGSTKEHDKAVNTFEEKVKQAKDKRAALLAECKGT
ncbi:MAG TPA: hypothetical protein VFF87_02370 [Hyphomicrobium sp.]|nr:hypothetical protein [Hyphomicrobium sp.]